MADQTLQGMDPEALDRLFNELTAELSDLPAELEQAHQELFNLRFRLATRQLEDTSQIGRARKRIARIKTTDSRLRNELAEIDAIRRERQASGRR